MLIFGDSFSANEKGWPSMLGQHITNSSQNGIGEYKIYKMVMQKKDDVKIICHTSPWRIHTPFHPIHNKNLERPNNDFLLSDIDYHSQHNDEMKIVKQYYGTDPLVILKIQILLMVAIKLQKSLMNFTTNQSSKKERAIQITALKKTLKYFGENQ